MENGLIYNPLKVQALLSHMPEARLSFHSCDHYFPNNVSEYGRDQTTVLISRSTTRKSLQTFTIKIL